MFKIISKNNFIKYVFILQIFYSFHCFSVDIDKANPEDSKTLKKYIASSLSKNFMIVCADKRAAMAARKVLEKGGNAIDASIAAQNVLSVVEPQSSGIGGGGFLLYYDNKTNNVYAWDGREFAPRTANKNMFTDNKGKKKSFLKALSSNNSIGVPGLYSMLADVHKEYGILDWKELFYDAINLSDGFKVSERLNYMLNWAPHLKQNKNALEIYFNYAKPKKVGEIIINKELNKTLKLLSENPYSVNNGKIAHKIVKKMENVISFEDLQSWKTIKRKPLCKEYLNFKICGFPPPTSGGLGVLQILKILENFKGKNLDPDSHITKHVFLEASRLAYTDRDAYIADPDFFPVPVNEMLSDSYLKSRSKTIDLKAVNLKIKQGNFKNIDYRNIRRSVNIEKSSTTHISIVDQFGNAVSLTSSVEFAFGSGKIVGGFFLNNQLTDFSYFSEKEKDDIIANSIQAFKKPRSSMAPTLVFKEKELHGVVGSPGGSRIICYVAQSLFYLITYKYSVDEVLEMPHLCSRNYNSEIEENMNTINIEKKLIDMGHNLVKKKMTSGLNIIWKEKDFWHGGSDPRREGVAIGF